MLDIKRLHPSVGAEITGLDLSAPMDEETAAALRSALWTNKVIAVRDQTPSPEALIAFARAFGPLEPFFIGDYNLEGHPEIYVLSNVRKDGRPIGRDGAGTHWHSDSTFTERPSAVTVLYAQQTPARGGDTLFVDTAEAYGRLDNETKARLEGAQAIHRYQKKEFVFTADRWTSEEEAAEIDALKSAREAEDKLAPLSPTAKKSNTVPDRLHPVVRTHPVTGEKALYLNDEMTVGIEGWAENDGRAMLSHLCEVATDPDHVLRYKWRPGDLVAWDNAAVVHAATFTPPDEGRVMYRLTVEGTVPV